MKLRIALLAATVLAAPVAFSHSAVAQPVTGPYVAGGFGYNIETSPKAKDFTVNNSTTSSSGRIVMKNGFTGEASLGYGFGNGFRVELEGDYIHDNFNKVEMDGVDQHASGGEARYGVFANALYDFDIGLPYLYPYIGAGVGWQADDFNKFNVNGAVFSQTRDALAYQAIAGASYPIPLVYGLSATLEYRYVVLAGSHRFEGAANGEPVSFKFADEANHQILLGLRYQLFTPRPAPQAPVPAAPAAAPAPAPAKTYLVFFDWNKANLTARATQVIAKAASDSKTNNVTTLEVSGYTDTSGTPDNNQRLSERRAQAVAAQLVSDGVAQSEIEIHGYGASHLLISTGSGVREPQNRRVEIILE